MKLLITGFQPFGGEKINSLVEIIRKLDRNIVDAEIVKAEIPKTFYKLIKELERLIDLEQPNMILCVGQAGRRYGIIIERVAINIDDASIPDNDGNQPIDEPAFNEGENAYFSNIPIKVPEQVMNK